MKTKILIFDADAILPEPFQSNLSHATRTIRETIQTQHHPEAHAKAQLERPDLIFFISKSQSHSNAFEAFKAELSRNYLTHDIPLVYWSPSRNCLREGVPFYETKTPFLQTRPEADFSSHHEDLAPLEALPEDAPKLLNLICEEFMEKLNALGLNSIAPLPPQN